MKNNNPPALGQKENAKHGEVFFPVQKYITRLAADYPVITTHWHDDIAFLCFIFEQINLIGA